MRRVLSLVRSGPQGNDPNHHSIPDPNRDLAPDPNRRPPPDVSQRRLYLLGAAFLARGMKAEDAYNTALYYTKGSGRRQNWISALSEQDSDSSVSAEHKNESSETPATDR